MEAVHNTMRSSFAGALAVSSSYVMYVDYSNACAKTLDPSQSV